MAGPTPSPAPTAAAPTTSTDQLLQDLGKRLAGGQTAAISTGQIPWAVKAPLNPNATPEARYSELNKMTAKTPPAFKEYKTLVSEDQAVAELYNLSPEAQRALGQGLYKASIISDPNDFGQVLNAWQSAVKMAGNAAAAGRTDFTPWDAVDMMLTYGVAANGGKTKSLPKSRTQTDITIPSPSDAKALITDIFQQEMGRNPTEDQLKKYTAIVMGTAKKGTTTTQNYTYDSTGNVVATTSTSQSAPNYKQIVTDQVQADPHYAAYQAATTYYNAAMQAIGSPI